MWLELKTHPTDSGENLWNRRSTLELWIRGVSAQMDTARKRYDRFKFSRWPRNGWISGVMCPKVKTCAADRAEARRMQSLPPELWIHRVSPRTAAATQRYDHFKGGQARPPCEWFSGFRPLGFGARRSQNADPSVIKNDKKDISDLWSSCVAVACYSK